MTKGKTQIAGCVQSPCPQVALPTDTSLAPGMDPSRSSSTPRSHCQIPNSPQLLTTSMREPFLPHHPLGTTYAVPKPDVPVVGICANEHLQTS